MARKGKKKLYLYPSTTLASTVVGGYIGTVPGKLTDMTRKYTAKVSAYLRTPTRQAEAVRKLSLWYDALFDHVDRITDVYGDIRKEYRNRLKASKGVAVPAPPPPAPAPAPAPVPAPVV